MVTAMNKDKALCGCFGLYPSFVAGNLDSVKEIHFYVLCSEKLNYENSIEKCVVGKECTACYKSHTGDYFQISFQSESVLFRLKQRLFMENPECLVKIQLPSLAYAIVGEKPYYLLVYH